MHEQRKGASEFTKKANARLLDELPFEDQRDFEEAARGLIAPFPHRSVSDENGRTVWDRAKFSFIEQASEVPDTVNPSLWRQSQLCLKGGLFKVVDRLYQVRNADLSNLTIVEGDTGLIIVDPLTSVETARAALELYFEHRPQRPVVAVVHSHSHVDHYGGVRGVLDEADVKAGKVRIIAPVGFLDAAVAENVLAGNVMSRRSMYQYGMLLRADPKGHVGSGLGMHVPLGTITLIPPTEEISETGQKLEIDGLSFEFLLAPDTEAPSEMHWYIEELGALTAAENCCHTLHNTYTLRGAPIRDPLAWSRYLNDTIDRWGTKTQVLYGMHHWPVWERERVLEMLGKARDAYRYINDQTLRLANKGYTPAEIAEMLELPTTLARHWAVRDYYGSLNHNVKATYVKYLGWFDGNPATLHVHPPVAAAKRYVEFMGGAEDALAKARRSFDEGDYRWVAEVVNHVVFADPANREARTLQADVLEQLGYQAESGPWRDIYLTGALELRQGLPDLRAPTTASPDSVRAMTLELLFNYLGVRLNGTKAAEKQITLNLVFTDTGEKAVLELANGSLNHSLGRSAKNGDATVTLSRPSLDRVLLGETTLLAAAQSGEIEVEPDMDPFAELLALLDDFDLWFNIVEP
jgi:alkyl sulfatase BDS1-like metallo-beta-lactamase superfamily hydrolase